MIVEHIPKIPLHLTGCPHQVETALLATPCQRCNLIWEDFLEQNLLLPMTLGTGIGMALLFQLAPLVIHTTTDVLLPRICL